MTIQRDPFLTVSVPAPTRYRHTPSPEMPVIESAAWTDADRRRKRELLGDRRLVEAMMRALGGTL